MEATKKTPASSIFGGSFFYKLFKFFASLKLAIFVLVTLMIIMATGTIIESLHGTNAARLSVYQTWWFNLVIILLGINVLTAALDRIPWKTKHLGFVTTHLGIILILIGSFVTQQMMIDGQMILEEGEVDYRITVSEPLIYVSSRKLNRDWIIPFEEKPFVWEGDQPIAKKSLMPLDINLISYFPKSRLYEEYVEAEEGPGYLQITIHNSFLNQTLDLVENDSRLGSIPMGPATFSFSDVKLQETKPSEEVETSYLEFQFDKANVRIPIDFKKALPYELDLEGTNYKLKIEKIFRNAAVIEKELLEQPDLEGSKDKWGKNPAVEFIIEGDGVREKHTSFMKFPDFPTMHGMKESQTGARIFYRKPGGGSAGETHELRFIKSQDTSRKTQEGKPVLLYQVQDGFKVETHEAVFNKDISLGWMDLQFKIEDYLPHAKKSRTFRAVSNSAEGIDIYPAAQIEVMHEGEKQTLWLGQSLSGALEFGDDDHFRFIFGQQQIPAGFKLELKDFRIEQYPGTNQPASFESDVVLRDDSTGTYEEVTISMNEPLEHRGFKIYQSGYDLEGPKEVSIFAVGKDPGIPFKYVGTIVMVIGIVTMFFTRKYSTRAGKIG